MSLSILKITVMWYLVCDLFIYIYAKNFMKKSLLSLGILFGIHFGFAQSIDTNFGTNGTVTHAEKGNFFQSTLLPDGKVILSGNYESNNASKAVLMKLNTDGSLDQTFATGGIYTVDAYTGTDRLEGFSKVEVQGDGKLFLAYASQLDNGIDPISVTVNIMRLNANGTPDTTFTNPWSATTDEDDALYGFKLLPGGKYLGYGENYLMRFNANGSLDTTYGTNGIRPVTFEINEVYVNGTTVYIDAAPNGNYSNKTIYKLINETAGASATYPYGNGSVYFDNANFFIDQYPSNTHEITKLDGNLAVATTFGTNGKVTLPQQNFVSEMLFQPGGSIILYSSMSTSAGDADHKFTRLNSNGALNTSFGQGGTFTMAIPASTGFQTYAENLVHPNGSIYNLFYGNNSNNNIHLKRIILPNELLAVKDNVSVLDKISIVENPVGNMLRLSADLENANIYDVSGKLMMRNLKGREHNVGSLSKGVYIINGKVSNGQTVKLKFIKK